MLSVASTLQIRAFAMLLHCYQLYEVRVRSDDVTSTAVYATIDQLYRKL
jgi:hypothetical protein